jgi:proteasome lid subunit RPN8/RPN11
MKVLLMENEYLDEAKQYALLNPFIEVCGLIIDDNGIKKFLKCDNKSKNPRNTFTIDPLEYIKAKSKGNILGCFHSHIKDSSFSPQDIFNSFKHNLTYYLYNIKKDKFYIFDPKQNQVYLKYINLKYENGIQDCHTLLKDFYLNELNLDIDIKNIPNRIGIPYLDLRNNKNHDWSLEKYKSEYERNNFNILYITNIDQLKLYDVIVFKDLYQGVPVHGALFIGNDLILHQRHEVISLIESIRKGHIKYISYILRHKSNE